MTFFARYRIPYLVLIAALIFTGAVTYYLHSSTQNKDRLRFESLVQRTQTTIEERVFTYVALLRATAGLFVVADAVTLDIFRDYIANLDIRSRYPGIQGIGFSMRIDADTRELVEQQLRLIHGMSFRIWPDHVREEYHPVIYLEPMDARNKAALGYDMFTETMRHAAMARARDTGRPAASGKVTLVQEIDENKQAGFLIYYPIYSTRQTPPTIEDRREKLIGFVYTPFRADDLLNQIFRGETDIRIDFNVYDGLNPDPAHLLHASNPAASQNTLKPRFTRLSSILVAGRPWTIQYSTRPEFELSSPRSFISLSVALGLLMSFTLFSITLSQAKAKNNAERIATELRASEEALRRSQNRARLLAESNLVGVVVADEQGKIVDANEAFLQIVGYTREDVNSGNVNLIEMTPHNFRPLDQQATEQMQETGRHAPYEKEYMTKQGKKVPVLVGTALLENRLGLGFTVDLSARKTAEAAVRESLNLLQAIIDGTNDGIYVKDLKGRYLMMNAACASFFNRPLETLLGKTDTDLFGDRIGSQITEDDKTVLESGQTQRFEDILPDSEGRLRIFQSDKGFYRDAQGNILGIIGIARDITDLKEIENRLRDETETLETINRIGHMLSGELDLKRLVQAVTDATTILTNADFGAFFYKNANHQEETMHFDLDAISGEASEVFSDLQSGQNAAFFDWVFGNEKVLLVNDTSSDFGAPLMPSISRPIASFLAVPVLLRSAETIGGLFFGASTPRIFSDREQRIAVAIAAQAAIAIDNARLFESTQKERAKAEVLFKEVHHRVKNNLQIILSLFRLQSSYLDDTKSMSILADSSNRIRTMALIHEKLYQSEDLERVDFDKYIEALATELIRSYAVDATKIQLRLECKDCYLSINTAVPLGLIVNELISNALKYAFPDGAEGCIHINMRKQNASRYCLVVKDNGIGLPESVDLNNTNSLGLRLVSILVSQLQGHLEIDRDSGTVFRIEFAEQN